MNDKISRKFGIFYVTFNRSQALRKAIESTLEQTLPPGLLVIVDNANSGETKSIVEGFARPDVVYVGSEENLGSAGGTALGVRYLFEQGYDWICCGDDDNPPISKDSFERLIKILESAPADVAGVGAFGSRWNWKKGELIKLRDDELQGVLEVDFIGGNHLLVVRREVVASVGTPNERLFFGYPDLEYCLRIRKAGYRLLIDGDLMKAYRIRSGRYGAPKQRTTLPRRPLNSVWRDYYTTRNYIHMMRMTFSRSDLARRACLKAILKVSTSWVKGPGYALTFAKLQFRGIRDGYLNRLGRTVQPVPKEAMSKR